MVVLVRLYLVMMMIVKKRVVFEWNCQYGVGHLGPLYYYYHVIGEINMLYNLLSKIYQYRKDYIFFISHPFMANNFDSRSYCRCFSYSIFCCVCSDIYINTFIT